MTGRGRPPGKTGGPAMLELVFAAYELAGSGLMEIAAFARTTADKPCALWS
jgi:hypothetical protein